MVLLAALFGCGSSDGLNRQAISGKVTLDGDPLTSGAILFEPTSKDSGTAVGATIRQGSFAVSRAEGPVPGSYRVRVYASTRNRRQPPAKGANRSYAAPHGRTAAPSLQCTIRATGRGCR